MKNIPEKIYLQVDSSSELPDDFNDLAGVTWCAERIHETDIEYLLKPVKTTQPARYRCLLCGRDKFTHKTPHNCVGGYRKRKIKWEPINWVEETY